MRCESYIEPRLAAVDDSLNPLGEETFFAGLAGTAQNTMLDMGCGAGRLAASLAGRVIA